METVKFLGLGESKGRMQQQSTEDFSCSENTLYDTAMMTHVITSLYKPTECATPRLNSNISYRL